MIIEDFENVLTLLAAILGLFGCLFKYIKTPRRGYLYLIIFFLANFLSDYYWTIYTLVMRSYPEVSELLAYFGWNVGYLFLLLAVISFRSESVKHYFHPIILWPVLTNIWQFFIYIQFGGIFNNLWQVGVTTIIMIVCMQEIMFYLMNRKAKARIPYLAILVMAFLISEYGMWTASCFTWSNQLLDPYYYCTIVGAVLKVMFAWGAEKEYGIINEENSENELAEFRYQMLFQAIVSVLICGASLGGFILATALKESMLFMQLGTTASDKIVIMLFIISLVLSFLILGIVYIIDLRYKKSRENLKKMDAGRQSRYSFIFTLVITFFLILIVVVYNASLLYNSSVTEINENAKDVVKSTAAEIENYITVAETTLRVVADSTELMEKEGASSEEIYKYLEAQTKIQSQQFDENFTGIYAYVDGVFMDGSGWNPPEGYDPTSRDWYKTAIDAKGEIAIVSPYLDAQTGEIVITFVKGFSEYDSNSETYNVVCLDVIVNHIQEITEKISIAGKGYGMVLDQDGFVVAHHDNTQLGKAFNEIFNDTIIGFAEGQFDTILDGEHVTLYAHALMEKWVVIIVVSNTELLESVHSQLALNILISIIIFILITFFYYFGYRIERHNDKKVEELNMEVVSALAEAIDAKDTYTNGHSSRVAKYSKMIAARNGYSEAEQDEIYMMGLLHDVGKIGVPDEVINKTTKLTDEEYAMIKTHPVIGSKILGSIKANPKLATGARWHHERFDGKGYPDGIAGETIPVEARIIAVADAYDAMTSRRSYRGVMPQETVRNEIEKGMGTQFDPKFAKTMLGLIDEDNDYTMREK